MNVRSLAKILAKRPKTVVLLFTMLTFLIGSQASNVYMVSDYSSYLPQNDAVLEIWDEINEEFQIGSAIIILINQSNLDPNDIREPEVLDEMDSVYRVLYEYPKNEGKDTGIKSITCLSKLIRNENNKPKPLGNAEDDIPDDKDTIYTYMERATISRMRNAIYTKDFKYTVMIIQLERDADFDKVLENVKRATERLGNYKTSMTITGTVAMQKAIQQKSMQNMVIIFPFAIVFVSIVLFIFNRNLKGVLIAFIPPAFALASTFGILGIFAPELTLISVAIIALLIGLGVDYSIHLMNRLGEEKGILDDVDRVEKILRSTGKAVLLSTITTVIGFASLMISNMSPMVTFGFGCAVGILFCFISAIIVVPCLVIILKFEKERKSTSWKKLANFALKYRKRLIIIAMFLSLMSIILIPQVKTDVNYFDMTPADVVEREAMFEYSEKFSTGGNFNAFLVETDPYGLEDPDVINGIYALEEKLRARGLATSSVADGLVEVYDILTKSAIIEEFANLTDADNIIFDKIAEEGIVNKDRSKTIILVSIPLGLSIEETERIVNEINSIAENTVLPHNGHISKLTGQDAVYVAVNNKLYNEQTRSMMIALILVLAALIFIFNSSLYGILTMIPVFFVLSWEPGFLVGTEIPLSMITVTIASIMVGIGIDYGVHITHRLREEMEKGVTKIEATRIAIEKTGLSLFEAALTTIAGISSIFIINIPSFKEFGIVVIFMTSVSCIAAALLLPAVYDIKR